MKALIAEICGKLIVLVTRLVTAVQVQWRGRGPAMRQRIYYANHTSHGDFMLIWSALPPVLRERTRPVAGADYWLKGFLQRFVAADVFRSVFIDRQANPHRIYPLTTLLAALDEGASLILFPEGTRNTSDKPLLAFRSGLYHLARKRPEIELVPVWLANLNRVLPKGELLPVPFLCSVTFGEPLRYVAGETKSAFLTRAHSGLLKLAPKAATTLGTPA